MCPPVCCTARRGAACQFKGPRTATYTQVMQTTVDDLKKKEARDHQVLVHPRDDSDNMLAAIADEIG